MILTLEAFAPAGLLVLGGLLLLVRPSAVLFGLVELAALGALLRLSQLSTAVLTVPVYDPVPDIPLALRFDRLSLFFATSAVAAGLLLALPRFYSRGLDPLGWLTLAQAGAVLGILAGNLQGLAVGWGGYTTALVLLVLVPEPGGDPRRPSRAVARHLVVQLTATLMLIMAAVTVGVIAGTTNYDAVPVGVVDSRSGLLLAVAPLLALATISGLARACRRPLVVAAMLCGAGLPLAAYTLARAFDLSEGHATGGLVGAALFAVGASGASLLGLYSTWSPDLGALAVRLLSALGMLLVAAFGVGGPLGLVAMLVGFVSLEVIAGVVLVMVDGGRGRLPGAGAPAWLAGTIAIVVLASLGGLVGCLGLEFRLLLVRALLDHGLAGAAGALAVVAASCAIVVGAGAAGRFGGGPRASWPVVAGMLLAAATAAAATLAGPAVLSVTVALAAAAARVPTADVRSVVLSSVPGFMPAAVLTAMLLLAAASFSGPLRRYSTAEGIVGVPDILPPKASVIPAMAWRSLVGRALHEGRRTAGAAGGRPRAAIAVGWGAAALVLLLALR